MNFIWTNHALDRIKERKITQDFASNTLQNPDEVKEEDGAIKYSKNYGSQRATAIVKKNNLGESIVVSFWVDPPNPGTKDFRMVSRKKDLSKAGPIRKIFITFLNQLGL